MSQTMDVRNCIDPGVKYLIAGRKFNTPTRAVVFRRQTERTKTNKTGASRHATIPLPAICQDWVDFHYLERRRKMRIVDTSFLPHIDRNLPDNLYDVCMYIKTTAFYVGKTFCKCKSTISNLSRLSFHNINYFFNYVWDTM